MNATIASPVVPRCDVLVRPATMGDLPFVDRLQKLHARMVGWMPTKQLEGKIEHGQVVIAEDQAKQPVGYCIGHDQYFKRDDVGIIYQMNVAPAKQRSLIGAALVKAMFDRAAYGCKLFCCWCAQDIEANYFWESLGFVPLAFRAGSEKTARVHVFWQRRIRAGDVTTPYWFPSQTAGGSIREDRLVLPIPPGTHWSDAKPIVLPAREQLPGKTERKVAQKKKAMTRTTLGAPLWFVPPAEAEAQVEKVKAPRTKRKNDPKLIAAARELRDRWLERVNADPSVLESGGKYDVSRQLEGAASATKVESVPMLEAA
jgi:hypothetical protein